MNNNQLIDFMEDSLTEKDLKRLDKIRDKMKLKSDEAYCAMYDLELLFFNRGVKSSNQRGC